MLNTQEKIKDLIQLIRKNIPDWEDFSHPEFMKEEVTYKQEAALKAKGLLDQGELEQLIADEQYNEIISRLIKVGRSTNLLFHGVPMKGDLSVLNQPDLNKPAFCRVVVDLLYGSGDTPQRLNRYISFLVESKLPNKWTFPTYLLFMRFPDKEIFIKPRTMKWFLEFLDLGELWNPNPSGEVYHEITEVIQKLRVKLSKYQPRDMIDLQGFIWMAASTEATLERFVKPLASPFSKVFSCREQAEWAFDMLNYAARKLGIDNADHPLTAFTIRRRPGEDVLRFSYGPWLVLGFSGVQGNLSQVTLALSSDYETRQPINKEYFSQPDDNERKYALFFFSASEIEPFPEDLQVAFDNSLAGIVGKFGNWQGSPHHCHSNSQVAEAVFDLERRNQLLSNGLEVVIDDAQFWKISPEGQGGQWSDWKDGCYISIGLNDLGDLSRIKQREFDLRVKKAQSLQNELSTVSLEQVWEFTRIRKGDRIVATRGTNEVLGIGTVSGDYYFLVNAEHSHRIPIQWEDLAPFYVEGPGWEHSSISLSKEEFETIRKKSAQDPEAHPDAWFTVETFQLLGGLRENPTSSFYQKNKEQIKLHVETPLQNLMHRVAALLPPEITQTVETEKKIFARILKNDFGQGGAWDFYWGAFYTRGGKRTEDAQLSIMVDPDRYEAGFYVGNLGSDSRARLARICKTHYTALLGLLKHLESDPEIYFGPYVPHNGAASHGRVSLSDWLSDPLKNDCDVSIDIPHSQVINLSKEDLVQKTLQIFLKLFPLVLLATLDNPLPAMARFLGQEEDEQLTVQPEITLESCAQKTGFDLAQLEYWVRAIKRKGQAIFYGPPGTGKTFIARTLAQHLIGGGDGVCELVQFHPAYAYEDFMAGIRPQSLPEGGLHYPVVKGRFLTFCEQAAQRSGTCVLIIDEINRANLARVFGELMYLLEYRDERIPLATGEKFSIPENVRIIGTMNTADRSIALVDHALRRRFAFLELRPNYEALRRYHKDLPFGVDGLITVLKRLNNRIQDPHYEVGISYFLNPELQDQIQDIWEMEVMPYLREFFFDRPERAEEFNWNKVYEEIGV